MPLVIQRQLSPTASILSIRWIGDAQQTGRKGGAEFGCLLEAKQNGVHVCNEYITAHQTKKSGEGLARRESEEIARESSVYYFSSRTIPNETNLG